MRLAVVMTVFNRKLKTLECLRALNASIFNIDIATDIYLTDDGSTDGTSDAVRAGFPDAIILKGDGNLYWSGGMRLAFGAAIQKNYDYYLWINDDTILVPDGLQSLFDTALKVGLVNSKSTNVSPMIIIGATIDPENRLATYGGRTSRGGLQPLRYELIIANGQPVRCDTMNGNCVLISAEVARRIGNIDPVYVHGMGDYDYGSRARAAKCEIWVSPGHIGYCSSNPPDVAWLQQKSVRARFKAVTNPKRFPFAPWWVFTRRYGGVLWLGYWVLPYLRALMPRMKR